MNRRTLHTLSLSALLLAAGPALAQDPEGADLEAEAALLGESGLLEKAPEPEKVTADPDDKMRAKVEAARGRVEQKINTIQSKIAQWPDLSDGLNELNMGMLKGIEGYVQQHRDALDKYRSAVAEGNTAAEKKHAKEVEKLRSAYLKQLEKLDTKADKLVEKAAKLEARFAEQQAEDAAAAAAAEAKAAEEAAEAEDDE